MSLPPSWFSSFAVSVMLTSSLWSAPAPKPWSADAFLPVTAERIAALPASEQAAWRAYWAKSTAQAKLGPQRDLVDHSATKPLAGGPIGSSYSKGVKLGQPAAWYASEEARVIADHVVNWQTVVGGWVKSGDYSRDRTPADDHHDSWDLGTFDNDSTIYELRFLALVQAGAAGDKDTSRVQAWRSAFLRGLTYALDSQYPNGGFPQIYPLVGWYHDAITFNDDAMDHILTLFRDVAARQKEFSFVPAEQAASAGHAVERGISCLLASQTKTKDGQPSVWPQQCDALTLRPCAARNFEPISACSLESVGLVEFLMTLPHPSPEIIAAIDGAVKWYPAHALSGVIWNRDATTGTGLDPKPGAPALWARFYEFDTDLPIFSERDRMVHYTVTELSLERRKGYGWYNSRAVDLPKKYEAWKKTVSTP